MSSYRIDDHPTHAGTPGVEPLAVVEAASPLGALDAYAELEGFATYSEQIASLHPSEADGLTYTLPDGRMGAICCNYEICATPLDG